MPLGAASGALARVLASMGVGGSAPITALSRAVNNPVELAKGLVGIEYGANVKNITNDAGQRLLTEFMSGKQPIPKPTQDISEGIKREFQTGRDYLIEVQCTDLSTGTVNTHQYLVDGADVDYYLENIRAITNDGRDEGCSGEVGLDVGYSARVF